MSTIRIWPLPGKSIPFPNPDSVSTLSTGGWAGEPTAYVWKLLRSGRVTDKNPYGTPVPDVNANESATVVTTLSTTPGTKGGQVASLAGHTSIGDNGGGEFVWDAADTDPTRNALRVGPAGVGVWKRKLDGKAITPQMFGAKGDAKQVSNAAVGTDDTAALQAFLDYIAVNECANVEWVGTFKISAPLSVTWSTTGGTKRVKCNYRLLADSSWVYEGAMLTITDARFVYFEGRHELVGNSGSSSGATYSSRKTGHGLFLIGCGRANFGQIVVPRFKYWGVRILGSGNGSMADLGNIRGQNCGQGPHSGGGQTTTFTVASRAGTANSTSQRTVLTVATLPPDDHYDDNDDSYDNSFAIIDGEPYLIVDKNNVAGTITIYPWIKVSGALATGGETGTLSYVTGGVVDIQGADSNMVKVGLVDATTSGVGLWSRSLYGCTVQRLVTQQCTIGLAIGRSFDSANLTSNIDNFYCEGNTFDFVQVTSDPNGGQIRGTYALQPSKCRMMAWPFTNSGAREHSKLQGVTIHSREAGILFPDGRVDNGETLLPNLTLGQSPGTITLYGDNKYRDDAGPIYRGITLKAGDASVRDLWGVDAITLVAHGTGSRGQPTGKYRFLCESGYTIHGSTATSDSTYTGLEFSGFTHPPMFIAKLVGTNWFVTCLQAENPLSASATVDPPSLAAGAVSSISTATVTGAALGDYVDRSFSRDLAGVVIDAWVSAADTVSYQFRNTTGSTVDLGSGTLRLRVRKGT